MIELFLNLTGINVSHILPTLHVHGTLATHLIQDSHMRSISASSDTKFSSRTELLSSCDVVKAVGKAWSIISEPGALLRYTSGETAVGNLFEVAC